MIVEFKAAAIRLSCPLFFHRLGHRCKFVGRVRFPARFSNIDIGDDCQIGESVFFQAQATARIAIGDRCSINTGCHIVALSLIEIGKNVAIGEYVSIRDQNHGFAIGRGVDGQGFKTANVRIGDNVWIGRGAYIGAGTSIGDNSIVGANSVVHGVFPPNVMIAGAPAGIRKTLS